MAFVPAHDVPMTFYLFSTSQSADVANDEEFKILKNYFKQTYIGGEYTAATYSHRYWNVHDRTLLNLPRTNNSVEGLNNRISHIANASHLSLWSFMELLQKEQRTTEEKCSMMIAGLKPKEK